MKLIFAFFVQEVNKPSPHLVTVKAMDSRILPSSRASVACLFKRHVEVARENFWFVSATVPEILAG